MIKVNLIQGYEDVLDDYAVDESGNVFSERFGLLKLRDNGHGYLQVSLKLKGVRRWKHAYIHRLVAQAFIPNPLNKPEVNHLDEDKTNNQVSNLEWATRIENSRHGTKNERMIRTRCDDVYVYDYLLNFVGKFVGLAEATRHALGRTETRALNRRLENYFFLDKPIEIFDTEKFLKIVTRSRYRTAVVENVADGEKLIFSTNRAARRFFNNTINVTDAIKHKRLIQSTYKIYCLDYSDLKDSPTLRECEP